MPVFKIHHITKYEYTRTVKESNNAIIIYPFNNEEQELLMHEIDITDNPDVFTYNDYWGNKVGLFNILALHKVLIIDSKLTIRTIKRLTEPTSVQTSISALKEFIDNNLQLLELSKPDKIESQEKIDEIIKAIKLAAGSTVSTIVEECCKYIFKHFKYIKGITTIETTVDEILEFQSGVCQDFAHLMLQILRSMNIPSRYVSGYICPNKDGMRGEGATHAWVEAYIPEYGWAGIDPTNNVWATDKHIKLAIGKNFNDCTPVTGSFKGLTKQTLSVYVSVGYEDGHVFEDVNDVKMTLASSKKKDGDPDIPEYQEEEHHHQQQQQQQ